MKGGVRKFDSYSKQLDAAAVRESCVPGKCVDLYLISVFVVLLGIR